MNTPHQVLRALVLPVMIGLALATVASASISWNIKITPSGGGEVVWSTTSPPASGTLSASGKLTFNEGSTVHLTFNPKPGYKLVAVMKNAENWTAQLDGSRHYPFGPVSSPHTITAIFQAEVPVGTFGMGYPTGSTNLPAMVDVTGHYEGVTPTRFNRAYSADVAMDEEGKLDVVGTLAGYSNTGGAALPHATGVVQSTSAGPVVQVKGAFDGTRDGQAADGSGSASVPAKVVPVTGSATGISGTASYKAEIAGTPVSDTNLPWQAPVTPSQASSLKRNWGVTFKFTERVSGGKSAIYCQADLTQPNGDLVRFAERAVKYKGAAAGYSVSFKGGTNITANRPAGKKTAVAVKSMTLSKTGSVWNVTGGTMTYSFLGQSGSGNVTDFTLH